MKLYSPPKTDNPLLDVWLERLVKELSDSPVFNGLTLKTLNIIHIAFPAAAVPSADPNTLDDYEEGVWTPDLQFGGAKVGITYSVQAGLYTKKGREVTCTSYIVLTNKGSSNGNATLRGLPFPVLNNDGAYAAVTVGHIVNVTFADRLSFYAPKAASHLNLYETTNAGVSFSLTDADFANNSEMMIAVTYFTN